MAVMTLSGFCIAPRQGHMDHAQCMVAYLAKMWHASIRFQTEEPGFSALLDLHYGWMHTVYGQVKEVIPADLPIPLGKLVILTHYIDINLYHDLIMGDQ